MTKIYSINSLSKKVLRYCLPVAAVVSGALLSACSGEDAVDGNGNDNGNANQYLAVNIVNVGSATTRAASDYVNGSAAEGNINNVRFYLFNDDGSPYPLTNSTPFGVNWLTVSNDSIHTYTNTNSAGTVERTTNAVLVINGYNGRQPSSIVAVANTNAVEDKLGEGSLSLSQLTASGMTISNYAQSPYSTSESEANFVMANSVYDDGSKTVNALELSDDDFFTTADSARDRAVDIYVERVAAKVRVRHDDGSRWTTATTTLPGHSTAATYQAYDLDSAYTYIDNVNTAHTVSKVYAVFDGWGLTESRSTASLEKNIDGISTGIGVGSNNPHLADASSLSTMPWNSPSYHRSFWEITPQTGNTVVNLSFNDIANNVNGKEIGQSQYTMPNTPVAATSWDAANERTAVQDGDQHLTKVVLAAYLMRNDGDSWTPVEICRYRGQNYLDSTNVKTAILNDLGTHILIGTVSGGLTTYSTLTADNIGFRVKGAAGTENSYRVEPYLKSLASGSQYYKYDGAETRIADINKSELTTGVTDDDLQGFTAPYVLIYSQGRTYYYTTIQHLWMPSAQADKESQAGNNLGAFGVVRNHFYDVNITGLAGWGTPVFNPDTVIIPVTPVEQRTYINAQINVLPWRQVVQVVNIDGNI